MPLLTSTSDITICAISDLDTIRQSVKPPSGYLVLSRGHIYTSIVEKYTTFLIPPLYLFQDFVSGMGSLVQCIFPDDVVDETVLVSVTVRLI